MGLYFENHKGFSGRGIGFAISGCWGPFAMMDVKRCGILFSDRYQGNGWWIFFALFSLFILSQILLGVRRKRNAGMPVDSGEIITVCIFCLGFIAVAIFQVLTHQ